MVLHNLRRAIVNAPREPVCTEGELDDTWVGGPRPGIRGHLKGQRARPGIGRDRKASAHGRPRPDACDPGFQSEHHDGADPAHDLEAFVNAKRFIRFTFPERLRDDFAIGRISMVFRRSNSRKACSAE